MIIVSLNGNRYFAKPHKYFQVKYEPLITLTTATSMQVEKYGNYEKNEPNSMLVDLTLISDLFWFSHG